MDDLLNLEEIRALRGRARRKTAAVCKESDAAQPAKFDPRRTGDVSSVQTQDVQALHHAWATQMSATLSAMLHIPCELRLASVSPMSGAEFLKRLPEPSYLASFSGALEDRVLLQIDLPLVFSILDLLLGGSGNEPIQARELTDIEGEIFEPVGQAFCRELRAAWNPLLKMDLQWAGRLSKEETAAQTTARDKILALVIEVRVQQIEGLLQLVLPSRVSAGLLRKLEPKELSVKPRAPQDSSRLREQLLEGEFEAELMLPPSTVSLRELSELAPGDVLVLKVSANEPVHVHVAGRHMFMAAPVRSGAKRGALVQKVLSIIPNEEGVARK
jgi:flagellar motor switch protein FliM